MEEPMRKVTMTGGAMRRLTAVAAAALLLSGCGVLEGSSPDEFRVVPRAPLEMPPDFNLRPPQPGSPRPQELARDTRAVTSVFGAAGTPGAAPTASTFQSAGEVSLIVAAGADKADPNIRAIVDRENPGVVVGDQGLLDRLLFSKQGDAPASTVHQGAPPVVERQGSTPAK